MKKIYCLVLLIFSCSTAPTLMTPSPAAPGYVSMVHDDLRTLPEPKSKILSAVYSFGDKTGQNRLTGGTNSRAVTQGADSMLIKAMEDSGWFIVLEREGFNNLTNERKIRDLSKIIRDEAADSQPLLYADILIEGGIIAYETNTLTGGAGARYLGVGVNTEIRQDQVTIYLRAVSTRSGVVLKTVHTTKTILSVMVNTGLYKYVQVKGILEGEYGFSTNEPPQMCVMEAIEKGVISLVLEGARDGLWAFKDQTELEGEVLSSYLKEKENSFHQARERSRALPQGAVSIEASAGVLGYRGDLPGGGLTFYTEGGVDYALSSLFFLTFRGGAGKISNESYFTTSLYHLRGGVKLKLLPGKKITPFVALSGGGINYTIENEDGLAMIRTDAFFGWKPFIHLQGGAEYFSGKNIGLSFDLGGAYNFTDQLDGVISGNLTDFTWTLGLGINYYPF